MRRTTSLAASTSASTRSSPTVPATPASSSTPTPDRCGSDLAAPPDQRVLVGDDRLGLAGVDRAAVDVEQIGLVGIGRHVVDDDPDARAQLELDQVRLAYGPGRDRVGLAVAEIPLRTAGVLARAGRCRVVGRPVRR